MSEAAFLDAILYGMSVTKTRNVCARRARKLRKRGEQIKFSHSTINGKARYLWMMRINPKSIRRDIQYER